MSLFLKINENFLKRYKLFCYFTLFLIGLGALVRVKGAGLACPDWPLCHGQWIPKYDPMVYLEFLHRIAAGIFAILAFIIHIFLLRIKNQKLISKRLKFFCILSLLILLIQILMGGLTVWLKLHTHVVTTHLFLGLFLFSLYFWIYWSLERNFYLSMKKPVDAKKLKKLRSEKWSKKLQYLIYVIFLVLCLQILLGGQVSTQHAGLACPDFPLCHSQWIPTLKGLIGLQVQHRLGAYLLTVLITILAVSSYKSSHQKLRGLSLMLLCMLGLQMGLGILNVFLKIHPVLSVSHLIVAALMIMVTMKMLFEIRFEKRALLFEF